MYKIITLAAAASLLALGACNRETETAPATDAAIASADAVSADSTGMDASATGPVHSTGSAEPAGRTSTGSETMAPSASAMAEPTGASASGVSDQTRDNAQAAAESTNLHPSPPQ